VSAPTVDRGRSARDLAVVWSVGSLIAAGLGLGAAALRPGDFWLTFGVFTACLLAPSFGLAWLVLGAGRQVEPDPHVEENVESRWFDKAGARALVDTLSATGVAAGTISVLGLAPPADLVLLGLVAFALVDGAVRYAVLARRES
jgi:hypothetical protein